MGLYLLNATLIWGFSLLAYELLFRNETVHHWNRAYLLLTLLLGLLLPLWTGQPDTAAPGNLPVVVLRAVPAQRVAEAKAAVVQLAAPERAPLVFSWWLVYGAGAAVALLRLLRDAGRIAALYRAGVKTKQHGWTLVETGREHSPFSFFQWVFLPAGNVQTPEARRLVLQHERRHGSLLHSLDMLLVQLVQVAFWFHPLVYAYRHRLALVHEYQADVVAGTDVQAYGHLLLAQATGAPVSSLVHSFYRSPLKNRIAMLVKHPSGAVRRLRYIVAVPVVVTSALLCSCRVGQEPGKDAAHKSNKIGFSQSMTDTLVSPSKDRKSNDTVYITKDPTPETLNGEKIYEADPASGITPARYAGSDRSATDQFFRTIKKQLGRLPDGRYDVTVFSPVVSKDGELAYFDTRGVEQPGFSMPVDASGWQAASDSLKKARKPIDPSLKKQIDAAIQEALRQPFRFKPATHDGVAVASFLEEDLNLSGFQQVEVKNGEARIVAARSN